MVGLKAVWLLPNSTVANVWSRIVWLKRAFPLP